MSKIYTRVSRVADWAGWCSPCGSEERPLVLTRSGPGGVNSWLGGLSDDDRILLLTCRVCGGWQFVPAREEDDPEILLEEDEDVPPDVREVVAAIVAEARSTAVEAPAALAPAPLVAKVDVPFDEEDAAALGELVQDGAYAPVAQAEEQVAVLPAPRPAVERIVTVPDPDAGTLPAFSLEAVEAAAQVLAAARATLEVPAPRAAGRPRRSRGGPTPRRVQRPATQRAHVAEVSAMPALPEVLGLPAGTRQLVLAAAS